MSDIQAGHEDNKNDTIHKTFTAVKIGTSVLPTELHSMPVDKCKTVDKCKCKFSCPLPIFLPFGQLIFIWNIFLLIILTFSIIEIPYSMAFDISTSPFSFIAIVGLFIDICLLFDIVINFRTAYIDKYDRLRIIHDPKLIGKRYLKSWFVIDFIAATPFTYLILLFSEGAASGSTIFVFFRLLRIVKLIRIVKILKMFHLFRENSMNIIPSRTTRMILTVIRTLCLMLLAAHYFACFWYLIGISAHKDGMNSWIDVIIENGDENKNNFIKYSYSFYWAIVTLFTTGYGDIHAFNVYEHWTCSIGILLGSCFFAYFISILTSGLMDDLKHQSKNERIEQSLEFCAHYNFPTEISRAIITHMRYYNSFNYLFDYDDIMNSLPTYLQNQVSECLATSVLKELDIFESLPSNIVGQIALKLKSISVGQNQFLYKAGDMGKELFIHRTGKSRLMHGRKLNKFRDRHLKRGDVIGENCILDRRRQHSVVCLMWSEFYVLDIYDIVSVLKDNFKLSDAQNEWDKIKRVIETTKSDSKICSEISEDLLDTMTHAKYRHVRFKTVEMKDYETYLDPGLCEDVSKSKSSMISSSKSNKYHRTFSEEELRLEEQDSRDRVINERKKKKMSFKSVTNMFKSMQKQTSHSRNKKVHSYHEKRRNLPNLAYSHVSPNDLDVENDDDNYLFGGTPTKSKSNGNQSVRSAGFFGSSINNMFDDQSERKNGERSIMDMDSKNILNDDKTEKTIELQKNIMYRNIGSDSMRSSEKGKVNSKDEENAGGIGS